jgi:hypothetical protein
LAHGNQKRAEGQANRHILKKAGETRRLILA